MVKSRNFPVAHVTLHHSDLLTVSISIASGFALKVNQVFLFFKRRVFGRQRFGEEKHPQYMYIVHSQVINIHRLLPQWQ